MKKVLNIFDIIENNIEKEDTRKKIELTHCLQNTFNTLLERSYILSEEGKYVYLGTHGKLDKILHVHENGDTTFYLGHYNDGVY